MKQFGVELVLLFVALLGVSQATAIREDNAFSFGWPGSLSANTDYYVSSKAVSWFEANYYCYSQGWELVAPESFNVQTLLQGFRELYAVTGTSYWSAGNRLYNGDWVWGIGGEKFSTSNWDTNEPNGNYTEKCLLIGQDVQSLWADADCVAKNHFICQKTKAKATKAPKKCKDSIF